MHLSLHAESYDLDSLFRRHRDWKNLRFSSYDSSFDFEADDFHMNLEINFRQVFSSFNIMFKQKTYFRFLIDWMLCTYHDSIICSFENGPVPVKLGFNWYFEWTYNIILDMYLILTNHFDNRSGLYYFEKRQEADFRFHQTLQSWFQNNFQNCCLDQIDFEVKLFVELLDAVHNCYNP